VTARPAEGKCRGVGGSVWVGGVEGPSRFLRQLQGKAKNALAKKWGGGGGEGRAGVADGRREYLPNDAA